MSSQSDDAAAPVPVGADELRRHRQRLKGMVRGEPQRLDLREQLAAVYRAEGNASQAGRWSALAVVGAITTVRWLVDVG